MEISDTGSSLWKAAVHRNFAIVSADVCMYKIKSLRRNLLRLWTTRDIEQGVGVT